MFRKKLIAGIMALTLCFSMGACGKAASGSGDTQAAGGATEAAPVEGADADYAKIREKGKLVVGITDFEPMDYKDESGKWIGFDAEMAVKCTSQRTSCGEDQQQEETCHSGRKHHGERQDSVCHCAYSG